MSDFVRNLIKWILVVILAVLVIFLIIKVANRGKQKVEGNPVTPIADTIREDKEKEDNSNKEETVRDELPPESTSNESKGELIVRAEDTASDAGITGIIGIAILGGTSFYLLKSKKKEKIEE